MDLLNALHRTTQLGEGLFSKKLPEDSDITVRQMILLGAIKENAGADQTTLMKATGIDRSTVSDMIRRLQRKGWAERRRSKEDSRAYVVKITEAGMAAYRTAMTAARKAEAELVERVPGVKHLA